MLVAIRVDSSLNIGSGHLMRCLTLAKRLKRDYHAEVHFICRDLEGNLNSLIVDNGFHVHTLPRHFENFNLSGYGTWLTVPQEIDAQETAVILQSLGEVQRLIVDSYAIDFQWERKVRPLVHEIFVIDDLANRKHDCDFLLDQNFYLDEDSRYLQLVPKNCKLFLGVRHALLREEFYTARENFRQRDGSIQRILIFYGGMDATDETSKALTALLKMRLKNVCVDVVVGSKNLRKFEIRNVCSQYENFHYHEQVDNMAELMNRADISLGAGGATTWERCFLGLPSIVTSVAENQVKGCVDLDKAHLIIYLGSAEEVTSQKIIEVLQSLRPENLRELQKNCLNIFVEEN